MSNYKYYRPPGSRYVVSIAKWNKSFLSHGSMGRWPLMRAEVYIMNGVARVEFTKSLIGEVVNILLLPFLYVIYTLLDGFPNTHREIKRHLFMKKYGTFKSSIFHKTDKNSWNEVMRLIYD